MARERAREIRVGTSGWSYRHWRGRFYPEGLSQRAWLEHYAGQFDTVEINSTFYHLPKESTCEGWRGRVPEGFVFACKASRFITHKKRLSEVEEPLETFVSRVRLLEDRLGPVLFQLPPSLRYDLALLRDFLALLPSGLAAAFEFRNKSWYRDETFDTLADNGVCFCTHDMPGNPAPRRATGPAVYIRFHGPGRRYSGCYEDDMLRQAAEWLTGQWEEGRSIYAYFNNDIGGHAIGNAHTLRAMLESMTG